ncbi:hypothetical protein DY218_21335 [Streptomyces triticagri]|uniref:Uncharacterized protein n=1 Tax=Streptomyces triticagri TaxID=2293568 RepID=A0A372M141_9ACTN|nr:hypothetical protein [Streptomyces triticagri]RFU84664.1 hypothetical protein DY218_21335 [Streptomyces triticagri]
MPAASAQPPEPAAAACPYCGWPDGEPAPAVVSEHRTARGLTVWTRCWCGSLQVRQLTAAGIRVSARGRPAEPRPAASARPERAQDVGSCRLGPS